MSFLVICTYIAGFNLLLGFFLLLYHFWRVKDLYNRILCLDLLVIISIGLIIVYTHISGFHLYIDLAVALSLVGFLATVALSRYCLSRSDKSVNTSHLKE